MSSWFTVHSKKDKGFTLVELMVAISIVAVLATIGFSLFQSTQATARDAKRRSDVDAMVSALETHFDATTGVYTAIDDTVAATWFVDKITPKDPLNDAASGYTYSYPTAAATTYKVCAKLENKGGNFSDQGTTPATGSSAVYYCKLNQQQ
ncbi:hypothetical protein A3A14_00090 [Candidatus Daviesbacteria bacterium RIFCSPLOWO2_01_FULL_43_38]|nr:MAG: hypothetical protein A2874_03020 [Candidatus Daviesbacteria bacterium RIFCSPHIGHO2_01_FULL_43_17]OGE64008.1 MAG: hypothetical protein A3A14_00090 [Candidatus Daviesbacteria bacterium RIFCSPLOWO2_01_FULL_43_38]OGE70624.1 MAG: hypothetical protein A3J21_02475 [Candidatus Daviesbacteria bacterium RIFCSPLOWO2_02_FULL_43_11]